MRAEWWQGEDHAPRCSRRGSSSVKLVVGGQRICCQCACCSRRKENVPVRARQVFAGLVPLDLATLPATAHPRLWSLDLHLGGSVCIVRSCRAVVRAMLATANCVDFEDNQSSWHAFCSMSGLDTSFPIHVVMVSRHTRTVYNTRRVCSLCPEIASWSGQDVMMSPIVMAALKRILG